MTENDPARPNADWHDAPCGLLVVNPAGMIDRVNAKLAQWLGYEERELALRLPFANILSIGSRIFYQTHVAPLVQMHGEATDLKLDLVTSSGERLPALVNIARRHDGSLTISCALMTGRALYEQELLLMRHRAEAAVTDLTRGRADAEDRALLAEQMIGIVSHDLRNPLMAILAGLDLLAPASSTERQQRAHALMVSAVHRAERLIRDLLDFTVVRLGSGLRMTRRPTNVAQLLADAVAELRLSFPDRTLHMSVAGHSEFEVDPDRLLQLLGNLVGNAVYHGAPDRSIRISLNVDDHLHVSVQNEGSAIPVEQQALLFEAMVRGQSARKVEGVGLGLFIVRAIAQAHGGEVTVSSSAETGTCFTARLAAP
jgi:sigma-B regulation protein RsbU (phosphoserine phosphatase)